MKKNIALLLVVFVLFSFVGCDNSQKNTDSSADYPNAFLQEHIASMEDLPKEVDYLEDDVEKYPATLIVNGKDISKNNHIMFVQKETDEESYFELPFLAILEEIGYEISWENEYTAKLKDKTGKTYTLRAHAASLVEEGRNWDLILFRGGGSLHWSFKDKVFVMSEPWASSVLTSEFLLNVDCDNKTRTVTVKEK